MTPSARESGENERNVTGETGVIPSERKYASQDDALVPRVNYFHPYVVKSTRRFSRISWRTPPGMTGSIGCYAHYSTLASSAWPSGERIRGFYSPIRGCAMKFRDTANTCSWYAWLLLIFEYIFALSSLPHDSIVCRPSPDSTGQQKILAALHLGKEGGKRKRERERGEKRERDRLSNGRRGEGRARFSFTIARRTYGNKKRNRGERA